VFVFLFLVLGLTYRCSGQAPATSPVPYDVFHKIHVPAFADVLMAKANEAFQKEFGQRRPDESEQDYALRKQLGETLRTSLIGALSEMDNLTLGWRLDRQGKKSSLDLSLTAQPNTVLAQQLTKAAQLKTAFGGFALPEAAVKAHWVGQAPTKAAAAAAKLVEELRAKEIKKIDLEIISDEDKKNRKELGNKVFDVIRDTAASGRSDGALSIVVQPNHVTLVAGVYLADAPKLEGVLKTLAQAVQQYIPQLESLKLDAEKCEGVNLHTLSFPIPEGEEGQNIKKVFGDSLEIAAGFAKQAIYLALGKDALKTLKKALEKSKNPMTPSSPMEISVNLQPLADFMALVSKDKEKAQAQKVAELLKARPGKDGVRLLARPIPQGITLHLSVEDGILQLIGNIHPEVKKFVQGK
jgi:hypothetical protein